MLQTQALVSHASCLHNIAMFLATEAEIRQQRPRTLLFKGYYSFLQLLIVVFSMTTIFKTDQCLCIHHSLRYVDALNLDEWSLKFTLHAVKSFSDAAIFAE